eukprot:gene19759-26453_t
MAHEHSSDTVERAPKSMFLNRVRSSILRTGALLLRASGSHLTRAVRMDASGRKLPFGPFWIQDSEIFCESELSFAFVNLKPVVPGHVLVSPKKVIKRFSEMSKEEVCDLWCLAHRVGAKLEPHFKASSLTMAIQDGPEAGQSVPHIHIHILPRKTGDFENNDEVYDAIDEASTTATAAGTVAVGVQWGVRSRAVLWSWGTVPDAGQALASPMRPHVGKWYEGPALQQLSFGPLMAQEDGTHVLLPPPDITLVAPDCRQLQCHISALVSRTGSFKEIFGSNASAFTGCKLPIQGVDSAALETLISSLYSGQCPVTVDTVVAVCDAAAKLGVPSLVDATLRFISEGCDLDNCCTPLLRDALHLSVPAVVELCLNFIHQTPERFAQVIASAPFLNCGYDTFVSVLKSAQAKPGVYSESTITATAATWLHHVPNDRRHVMFRQRVVQDLNIMITGLDVNAAPPSLATASDQSQAQLLSQVGMGRVWKPQAGPAKQHSGVPGGYNQLQSMQLKSFNSFPSSNVMSKPCNPVPQISYSTAPQLGPQSGNGMQWVLLPQSMLYGGNDTNNSGVSSEGLSQWNSAKPSQSGTAPTSQQPAMPMLNSLPNGNRSSRVDPSALLALQMIEAQIRGARSQGSDMISMQSGKTGLSSLLQASLQQGLESSATAHQASTSMISTLPQMQPQLGGFRVPTSQASSMNTASRVTLTDSQFSPTAGLVLSTTYQEEKESAGSDENAADADQEKKKILGSLPNIKRGWPSSDDEARKALKTECGSSGTDAVKKIVASNILSLLGNQDASRPASKLDLNSLKHRLAGSPVQMSSDASGLDFSAGALQDPRIQGSNNNNSNNNSNDMTTNLNTANNKHVGKAFPQPRPEKRSKTTNSIWRAQEDYRLPPSSDSSQMSQPHHQCVRPDGATTHQVHTKDTKSKSKMSGSSSGSNGSGSNGSGSNGSGSNGEGSNGSGSHGEGSNGSGRNDEGSNGSGSNGCGSNGEGSNGSGSNGEGSNGEGSNGGGSNGLGSNDMGLGASQNLGNTGNLSSPPSSQDPRKCSQKAGCGGMEWAGNVQAGKPIFCSIHGCGADIREIGDYYQRYKMCGNHLKSLAITREDGTTQRFCQQCGSLHSLDEFDGTKRSCRMMLQKRSLRRKERAMKNKR